MRSLQSGFLQTENPEMRRAAPLGLSMKMRGVSRLDPMNEFPRVSRCDILINIVPVTAYADTTIMERKWEVMCHVTLGGPA